MNNVDLENDVCQEENVEAERDESLAAWEHSRIIVSLKMYERMAALIEKETDGPAFPDVLALYMHYFYTARRQKTNQPWATASYCKKWFGWGTDKFHRVKNFLVENKFIVDIQDRDEDNRIKGHYIKVYGIPRASHPTYEPEGGISPPVAKQETNALIHKSLNAYKQNDNGVVLSEYQKTFGKPVESAFLDHPQLEKCIKYMTYMTETGKTIENPGAYMNSLLHREIGVPDIPTVTVIPPPPAKVKSAEEIEFDRKHDRDYWRLVNGGDIERENPRIREGRGLSPVPAQVLSSG